MNATRDSALILIADDNPVNLEVLCRALVADGLEIAVAVDGEMVLEQVRYEMPDLILLDALMPKLDGFETCKRLKDDKATCDIPIIFMTSLTEVSHKLLGLRLGAVDYVVKPFEEEEVLLRVKTHLSLRSMTRDLMIKNAELEREIKERTAAERARAELAHELELQLVERRRAEEKRAALDKQIIELQARRLHELATPIIPITDWLVVMPLIGIMDHERAEMVVEVALRGAAERRAEIVIMDITGVPSVDFSVASTLLRAIHALRLIGARVVITGIRPEVARTLTELDVDASVVISRGDLQSGIAYAMSERQNSGLNRRRSGRTRAAH